MKKFIFILLVFAGINAGAQIRSASLQASGLTCSMCSKAVLKALEAVPFVDKVQVDIKNQEYNLSFKENNAVRLDALSEAVQKAGFSVASLRVKASLPNTKLEKDQHIEIGGQTIHVLNAAGQTVNGDLQFSVVDKAFVSAKAAKKYAGMSKMACVQTGRMAKCCAPVSSGDDRIYHVVI